MKKTTSLISAIVICVTLFAGCTRATPKASPVIPAVTPSVMPSERVSEPPIVDEDDTLRPGDEETVRDEELPAASPVA